MMVPGALGEDTCACSEVALVPEAHSKHVSETYGLGSRASNIPLIHYKKCTLLFCIRCKRCLSAHSASSIKHCHAQ